MKPKKSDALILKIATEYYIEEKTQSEIAEIEKLSRPQISKLLTEAKRRGFVDIRIQMPVSFNAIRMQEELRSKYGIGACVVASCTVDGKPENRWMYLKTAADYLAEQIPKYHNIGLSWGNTVMDIAAAFPSGRSGQNIHFYPLVSNSGYTDSCLQSTIIVNAYASKFEGAATHYINHPLYITAAEGESAWYQRLLREWKELDMAIVGVGGTETVPTLYRPIDPQIDMWDALRDTQTKQYGNIARHFFCEDGKIWDGPAQYILNAIPFEYLKSMKNVVGVAFGDTKIKALDFTLKEKVLDTLITDQGTAQALLNY